jgi:hypothetical protein
VKFSVEVNPTDVARVIKATSKATVKDSIKIEEGIKKCLGVIHRKAQTLCPVDINVPRRREGLPHLRDSGREETTGTGMATQGAVVFEGFYAIYVHERLDVKHPVGEAKFLEKAVRLTRGTCASILRRDFSSDRPNPYTGGTSTRQRTNEGIPRSRRSPGT